MTEPFFNDAKLYFFRWIKKNNQQNQKTIEETSKQLTKNEVINTEQMKKRFLKFAEKDAEIWKFIKFNITVIVTSALDIISYLIFLYIVFAKYNTTPLQGNSVLSFLGIKYNCDKIEIETNIMWKSSENQISELFQLGVN